MDFVWKYRSHLDTQARDQLQQDLGIHPTLCALLAQRNIRSYKEAKAFFRPELSDLHDPFSMRDMDKAVERISLAVERKEGILIYGDYDVDGTTAVSLLFDFLSRHYDKLDTYIPDRYKEGYGVSLAGIDYAHAQGIGLIVALDCGIKAVDQVAYAKSLGIDFIICDHHLPGTNLPNAVAALDPKRADCPYPFKELSGCGVGFKLVQALCKIWKLDDSEWLPLLDLLAISIGADIVPIVGENRILAFHGLKQINSNPRPGVAQLRQLAKRGDTELDIEQVVFGIAPRINAAGRIDHGSLAVKLLTGKNEEDLAKWREQVQDHNESRREIDRSITEEALAQIAETHAEDAYTNVAYHPKWHKGVIGIVASRLIEKYYRPSIVFTESKAGILAGSARSVEGFDVHRALEACSSCLLQFGGHQYAAGMTMEAHRLDEFRALFESVVRQSLPQELRKPSIYVDAELELADFMGPGNRNFFKILQQFAPFGPQNMRPHFITHGLRDAGRSRCVGDGTHLRVELVDPKSGYAITGIGFGMGEKLELLKSGEPFSIAYKLELNHFNGLSSVQLQLSDIQATEKLQLAAET